MTQKAKETYNGWANYETWLVQLCIANDQNAYVHWRDRTKEILSKLTADEPIGGAVGTLADEIKNAIEDGCSIPKANLAADLMNAALSRVDWHEIAEGQIDSVTEGEG
jgi:hypothetical protein